VRRTAHGDVVLEAALDLQEGRYVDIGCAGLPATESSATSRRISAGSSAFEATMARRSSTVVPFLTSRVTSSMRVPFQRSSAASTRPSHDGKCWRSSYTLIASRSATSSGRASWKGTSRSRSTVAPTIVMRRCRVAAAAAAAAVSALVSSSIVPSVDPGPRADVVVARVRSADVLSAWPSQDGRLSQSSVFLG
jgi:hypothetical protein